MRLRRALTLTNIHEQEAEPTTSMQEPFHLLIVMIAHPSVEVDLLV